ncbi:MAG: hypothetical protein ACR2KB_00720 [Chitinophagaceae bacterium]
MSKVEVEVEVEDEDEAKVEERLRVKSLGVRQKNCYKRIFAALCVAV